MSADAVRDIAMNAYWQKDPADVSINAICQMAGVSKPSVYREFGSEDGLSLATLDHYAQIVLSDIFAILNRRLGMAETLDALIEFASADPRMETGCLFHKMLAGKHRLGPKTVAKVDEIDAAAQQAFRTFLKACRDSGEWNSALSIEDGARYLSAQFSLAFTQRAAGENHAFVQKSLTLALSIFGAVSANV
ncbi:MAG: TetR/AcrR family transcriptional regulator [Pseudomonadota bacterium]